MAASWGSAPLHIQWKKPKRLGVTVNEFPSFLPKEVHNIKDQFARNLATRIERLPVSSNFLLLWENSYYFIVFQLLEQSSNDYFTWAGENCNGNSQFEEVQAMLLAEFCLSV